MLHNVTKTAEIALKFHKSKKFFLQKNFMLTKRQVESTFVSRRDVAQSGSALEWGSRGRKFKPFHPDQLENQGLT